MSAARAERRRAMKAARKAAAREGGVHPGAEIRLANPVSDHYGAFIVGNAQYVERVVEQDSATGQHLVLCGAAPSLRDTIATWAPKADQLWGCNSAAIWLHDQGYPVTHAFTVDQTPAMVNEWASTPDLEYLVASTIHPHLTDLLRARQRRMRWFHNFVGIQQPPVQYGVCRACQALLPPLDGTPPSDCPHADVETRIEPYEDWLYLALYPGTIRAGSGLNAANRAIDVALFMGFERITLLGADCSLRAATPPPDAPSGSPAYLDWLRTVTMHADGGHALASGATPITLKGEIDGTLYITKPDLAISAMWLEVARRKLGGRLEIVGDGLVAALRDKPESFLQRMPALTDTQGRAMTINLEP